MNCKTIGLIGNPNCGKSTLFNLLTGARQKVGNWPGVTVECKSGLLTTGTNTFTIVDLPGIYQLSMSCDEQAIDERITSDYLLQRQADIIVNIIDASHLERHLYLTLQLLSMKVPMIVAVNMMDVASRRKIKIDLHKLQEKIGCPVIGIVASKGTGRKELIKIINDYDVTAKSQQPPTIYSADLQNAVMSIAQQISTTHRELRDSSLWLAQQLLEGSERAKDLVCVEIQTTAATLKIKLEADLQEDLDIVFADANYNYAHQINNEVSVCLATTNTLTQRIDKVVLNRFLGIPIFLLMMYCMFLFAINLGGAFQDFFDIGSDAVFVKGTTALLMSMHAPNWLIALLAAGFGKGINTTITFIPVIGGMFLFLAFLESSGYMARATFVIDRFMRLVGLPGKSFVPMIVGFGCNVPAILAARTLENSRDRTLTIIMSPFMSCGARLAIFAVFTAAFFPVGGQNIVFALYFIGIAAAIFTGYILRKTLLQGDLTPLILELPAYHLPTLKALVLQAWHRLKSFIVRAGILIVPICMLIGVLNAINIDGTLNREETSQKSLLAVVGRVVTPILSPMGIKQDNWPATVGLITGVMAKEVVIATLNTLYTQDANLRNDNYLDTAVIDGLKAAVLSVPTNLLALKESLLNPMITHIPKNTDNHGIYGIMYERFSGKSAAFAYLLFVLLYFPCISATAVMVKELNKKWTFFSVAWSTGIAYVVATSFYQLATFTLHPKQSCIWLSAIAITFGSVLSLMKKFGQTNVMTKNETSCSPNIGCQL